MKYEFSWTVSDWYALTRMCQTLQDEGWEIFTICPMEMSYCRIVHRREARRD